MEDLFPITPNAALHCLAEGRLALGFGITHLRGAAAPQLARAAGYHWLSIDMEHGALSLAEAAQLCIAALPVGVAPLVRIGRHAFDEGTRALDNGAQGLIVPNVETAAQARQIVDAFRYPPAGRRPWGANTLPFGYRAPPVAVAKQQVNAQTLLVAMVETAEGVANAQGIAATPGIDVVFVGASDLSADVGEPGQFGTERMQQAFRDVGEACRRHGKVLGMGGVYDTAWARRYVSLGARFVAGGNDQGFILSAAGARATFLNGLLDVPAIQNT